jgi:hypothetical protein
MTTKSRKKISRPRVKSAPSRTTNGIVDAVVINRPALSQYLQLQNLLSYFVDCMNTLTTHPGNYDECSDYLSRCIAFISSATENSGDTFNDELQSMLQEFSEDAKQFRHLVKSFRDPQGTTTADQTAAVLLTAKASHLQWLSVCILQDLKKSCRPC